MPMFTDEVHADDSYDPMFHGAFVHYKTDSGEVVKIYLSRTAIREIHEAVEAEREAMPR